MTPLDDELVAVTGDAHVMRNAALATAEGETTAAGLAAPDEPVVPAAVLAVVAAVVPDVVAVVPPDPLDAVEVLDVLDVLDVLEVLDALAVVPAPPLVAAVELELAGSLDPPPPPHAANASATEQIE